MRAGNKKLHVLQEHECQLTLGCVWGGLGGGRMVGWTAALMSFGRCLSMSFFTRLPLALASSEAFDKRILALGMENPMCPTISAWESGSEVRPGVRGGGWASAGALRGAWASRGGKLYPWRSTAAGAPAGVVTATAVAGEVGVDLGTTL